MTKTLTVPAVETLTQFADAHPRLETWRKVASINSTRELKSACEALLCTVKHHDVLDEQRKENTLALGRLKRKIDAAYTKPYLKPASDLEKHLSSLIADYRRNKINEATAKIVTEIDPTLPIEVQEDMLKVGITEAADAAIPDTLGVRVNSKWRARVVDMDAVPREYMIPNQNLLDTLAQESRCPSTVPGVVFEDVGTVIRRGVK